MDEETYFEVELAYGRWMVHDLKAMKMYPASSKRAAEIWAEALNNLARREGYDKAKGARVPRSGKP